MRTTTKRHAAKRTNRKPTPPAAAVPPNIAAFTELVKPGGPFDKMMQRATRRREPSPEEQAKEEAREAKWEARQDEDRRRRDALNIVDALLRNVKYGTDEIDFKALAANAVMLADDIHKLITPAA